MSDIFQEVDEEFKRDKVAQFMKRYSGVLIGLALAVIIAVAGYRLWNYFEVQKANEAGAKYEAALNLASEGKEAEARAAFEALAKESTAGYQTLAQFKLAADLSRTDKAASAKAFDALAQNANLTQNLRDLAKLRSTLLTVDTAPFAEVQQKLEPLTGATQPWRLPAREALAAAALKAGDYKKAQEYLVLVLGDAEASRGVRERAELMMALIAGAASTQ